MEAENNKIKSEYNRSQKNEKELEHSREKIEKLTKELRYHATDFRKPTENEERTAKLEEELLALQDLERGHKQEIDRLHRDLAREREKRSNLEMSKASAENAVQTPSPAKAAARPRRLSTPNAKKEGLNLALKAVKDAEDGLAKARSNGDQAVVTSAKKKLRAARSEAGRLTGGDSGES